MKRFTGLALMAAVLASGCQWLPFRKPPAVVAPKMSDSDNWKPVKAETINRSNAYDKAKKLDEELTRDESSSLDD